MNSTLSTTQKSWLGIALAAVLVLAVWPVAADQTAEKTDDQVIDLNAAEAAQKAAAEQRAQRKEFRKEHDARQTADYLKAVPPLGIDPDIESDMIKMRGLREWALLTYPTGTLPEAPLEKARVHVRENVLDAAPWQGGGVTLQGGTFAWEKATVTPSENVWTALGPQPLDSVGTTNNAYSYGTVAGRVGAEALAVDPSNTSVAYAGFVAGGLWKTTNLGSANVTWTPLWDDKDFVTQGVSAITLDPTDSNTIYVGTGDWAAGDQFSAGIMKSTDAGATWTQLGADVFAPYSPVLPVGGNRWSNQNVKTIDVDPKNPSTVLVGTRYDLYLSNDAGSTWQICGFGNDYTDPAAGSTLASLNRISGIYLDDRGANTVAYVAVGYLATGNNGSNGVYRFTVPASGCPSWPSDFETLFGGFPAGTGTSTTSSTGRIELAGTIGPDNKLTLYAQVEDAVNYDKEGTWVLRPDDGATTWTKLTESYSGCSSESTGQDWYDLFIGVDPTNDKTLYIGHIDILKATVNAGYTSMTVTNMTDVYGTSCPNYGNVHPDQHAITFVGNSGDFLVGNDGGVYYNDTGTAAGFEQLNGSFNTTQFYAGQIGSDFAGNGMNGAQWAFGGMQDNGNASWDSSSADATWTGRSVGGDGFYVSFDPLAGSETAGTWMTEYTYGSIYVSTTGANGPFGGGSGGGPFGGGCEPRYQGSPDWSTPFMLDTMHCTDSTCENYVVGEDYVWVAAGFSRGCPAWSRISGSQVKSDAGSILTVAMATSEPKAVATGTSDGKVWWTEQAFSGTSCTQAAANTASFSCSTNSGTWIDADASNSVLPNRAVLQVAFDPSNHDILYAAVGGFDTNTPSTPGHLFQMTQSGGSITVANKTGNLPDVPASSVAVNPHNTNQVFVGTHFGFYYTDDITATNPNWIRYQNGLPNTVIKHLTIDRGPASDPFLGTTLAAFTYGRGVYVLKLPTTTGGNLLPTADFTWNCTGLSCDFTDTSSDSDGTVVGWDWDFGDTNGSTQQNPTHVFAAGGTYSVTLTVEDNEGAFDDVTYLVTVNDPNVDDPPTANFSFSCTNLDCTFTDTSSDDNGIISWTWDFGDSNGSSAQNPSHSYASGATYTVTLTVEDTANQTDQISKQVTVTDPPTGDTTPPVVSNVQTANANGNKFTITFTTDEPATSQVTFTGGASGTYDVSTTLTTSHSVTFNGAKNVLYTFNIEATDAAANTSVTGPFQHQND